MATLDELQRLPGNRVLTVGNVGIGAIHPDARDLLDIFMAEWEPHWESVRRHSPDQQETAYSAFYWLCRWSGLIDPTAVRARIEAEQPALLRHIY